MITEELLDFRLVKELGNFSSQLTLDVALALLLFNLLLERCSLLFVQCRLLLLCLLFSLALISHRLELIVHLLLLLPKELALLTLFFASFLSGILSISHYIFGILLPLFFLLLLLPSNLLNTGLTVLFFKFIKLFVFHFLLLGLFLLLLGFLNIFHLLLSL